jgi:hypothetical protein
MDIKTISASADILEGCTVSDYLEVTYSEYQTGNGQYRVNIGSGCTIVILLSDEIEINLLNHTGLCLKHSIISGLPDNVAILTIEAFADWASAQ